MLGRKLASALAAASPGGPLVTKLTLADVVLPVRPPFAGPVETMVTDAASPSAPARLLAGRPDIIFHLAAIVSAEAEADFAKGYAINLDASRALFAAIADIPDYCPRVVFSSSTAVFGAPFPDVITDDFHLTPRSSYGVQKAMTEMLLADFTRRGFLQGIALRLPTICIRPGAANKAASSFFSGILREPLNGQRSTLPVRESLRHWFASPRAATGFFLHAATIDLALVGPNRSLNMPGLSATVAEQIEALRAAAGQSAVDLIDHRPDPAIAAIVETWPQRFDTARATALGFKAESNFSEILDVYLKDDFQPAA